MKNKILTLFTLGILVFTSLNVIANPLDENAKLVVCEKTDLVLFSDLSIEAKGDYATITFDEVNTFINNPGQPMLPVCVKVYKFPIGTIIHNVELTFSELSTQVLSNKIKPAPQPVPLISLESLKSVQTIEDERIYTSADIYPDKNFEYSIGVGLDGLQRVIFLTIRIYPVRYSPNTNTVYYSKVVDVKVSYENRASSLAPTSDYDMVIIAPRKFLFALRSLINHKNNVGVETKFVSVESIYSDYNGRDKQEDIKLFIKDEIENYNITYVLLVGARQGMGVRWALPARFSNLEDKGGWNETYATDLYYSDIYKYNETSHQILLVGLFH